jgi:hypothetical protein
MSEFTDDQIERFLPEFQGTTDSIRGVLYERSFAGKVLKKLLEARIDLGRLKAENEKYKKARKTMMHSICVSQDKLMTENKRLRETLEKISKNTFDIPGGHGDSYAVDTAIKALAGVDSQIPVASLPRMDSPIVEIGTVDLLGSVVWKDFAGIDAYKKIGLKVFAVKRDHSGTVNCVCKLANVDFTKLAAWLKEEFEVSPEDSDPWFRLAIAITENGYQYPVKTDKTSGEAQK